MRDAVRVNRMRRAGMTTVLASATAQALAPLPGSPGPPAAVNFYQLTGLGEQHALMSSAGSGEDSARSLSPARSDEHISGATDSRTSAPRTDAIRHVC